MTTYLLDSSALVKFYVQEAGSAWLRNDIGSGMHELTVAQITLVEVASALFRRVRGGSLPLSEAQRGVAQLLVDAAGFVVAGPDLPVFDRALAVAERYALRGYDCVQLATALLAQETRLADGLDPLVLISADAELNAAASAEGIPVEDPNAH